ncbi:hypothetical protein EDB89DRAFT_1913846 [Lactarius sanguifluus]|nr:hypothetical protein EDB89DRAFT_1913846 [Lactarius sanguifluus]
MKGISFVSLGLHNLLTLAYWRNILHGSDGTDTEFPEYDYITPLGEECTLPYMAIDVGLTQTKDADADTTLTEIDTPDSKSRSEAQVVLDDPQAIDRHQFGPSTQTKGANMALVEGDPSDSKLCSEAQVALDDNKKPCEEHKDANIAKKRKISN